MSSNQRWEQGEWYEKSVHAFTYQGSTMGWQDPVVLPSAPKMRASVLGTALPFPCGSRTSRPYGGSRGSPYSTWRRIHTPARIRGPWRLGVRSQTVPSTFSVALSSICSLRLQERECKGDEKINWSGAVAVLREGRTEKLTLTKGLARLEECRRIQAPVESGEPRHLWSSGNLRISTPCHGL